MIRFKEYILRLLNIISRVTIFSELQKIRYQYKKNIEILILMNEFINDIFIYIVIKHIFDQINS